MSANGSNGYAQLADGDRVHRRVYTDPAVFAAEMDRIFSRTWIFIGHESEVPKPGDFKTDTIGKRPIVLVRGKDNRVRALYNVCRHRGAKVCYEDYGNTNTFRCLYHGWTYDSTGKLDGVTLRERFQNFNPDDSFGLIPVPRVESYRGFIFASLAKEGASLKQHLGRGTHYLDLMCERAPDGEIEAGRPIKYDFRGNWKLQFENYSDNYHPAVLHQSALEIGIRMMREKYGDRVFNMKSSVSQYIERTYGAGHGMGDFCGGRGAMWMNAYTNPEYLKALGAKHGDNRAKELLDMDLHMMIYPNLLMHTRMNHYRVIKPLAVDHTEIWAYPCKLKGAPKDVNDTLFLNTSHHVSAMGEVQVDDLQCFAWVQEGLQVEDMEWVLLKLAGDNLHVNEHGENEWTGASEEMIRYQYREWAKLMGAA